MTSGAGTPVAGAVLVGGASRRMGRPKALIEVDGSPMVVRVAAALSAGGCAPVRLIGTLPSDTLPNDTPPIDTLPNDTPPIDTGPNDTGPNDTGPNDTGPNDTGPNDTGPIDTVLLPDEEAYPLVEDLWPGEGPLGGVITALIDAGGDVVVAACDLADLDAATVRAIRDAAGAGRAEAVVARTDRLEPALARWNHRALDSLTAIFASGGRALHEALGRLDILQIDVDPAAMRNINTPGDLGEDAASR